jgi:hypothetical protein
VYQQLNLGARTLGLGPVGSLLGCSSKFCRVNTCGLRAADCGLRK